MSSSSSASRPKKRPTSVYSYDGPDDFGHVRPQLAPPAWPEEWRYEAVGGPELSAISCRSRRSAAAGVNVGLGGATSSSSSGCSGVKKRRRSD
ncbi:unnamed protein product, partial [Amoebophrya sp. A25]|eukprot:GSA25T00022785001.1